jgi:hypothetical protein
MLVVWMCTICNTCILTVVVDKIGDSDAEQRTLKTGIQARQTLALDNALDGLQGVGVGLLGLDLGSGGEGDQRVSAVMSQLCSLGVVTTMSRAGISHVKAIDNSPPPAPASACATLSLCCEAMAWPAGDPKGAFCA